MKLLAVLSIGLMLTLTAFLLAAQPRENTTTPAAAPAPDVRTLAGDSNRFAVDLYKRLAAKDGNLFFSPASIYPAMGMVYAGARGQTADQMAKTMHLTMPLDRLNPAFAGLASQLNPPANQQKRPFELHIANALWAQQDYQFNPAYLQTTGRFFAAELAGVDFKTAAEPARLKINAWVEKQTNDKIKDLIPPGVLTADTRLVLTNAIYFKGAWTEPFNPKNTKDEPFNMPAARGEAAAGTVNVPMMHRTGDYGYFKGDGFAAAELPYAGDTLSIQVILPDKVDGLAELEKKLSADDLARWTFRRQEVQLSLPRFTMTRTIKLTEEFKAMGMELLFTERADLSGIGGSPGELMVTDVLHKAFVDVNEEGTEAAAATGIVVGVTSAPPEPVVFKADRPFMFVIRHKPTGAVLFIGRLTDPSGPPKDAPQGR